MSSYGKGSFSMISYTPLLAIMKERNLPRGYLREIGLHPTTVAKIYKGESISLESIEIICEKMDLAISNVICFNSEK
jgi:DNA-binding Xre family transcriptional regulator